jgi:copper chaperone CopZ
LRGKPDGCNDAASAPKVSITEDEMTSVVIDVPVMYADHHVVEVRRILFGVPGVKAVDASSAFRVVKIEFDPDKTSEDALRQILAVNGYLDDLQTPTESGKPAVGSDEKTYFRHTAAYAAAGATVSFGQEIAFSGRPLWPCPGMGAPQKMDD